MFDGLSALTVVLWVSSGAFLGGVVTPVILENKKVSGWLLALLGTIVGAIGFLVLLIPLWIVLMVVLPEDDDSRPAWQRDELRYEDAARTLTEGEGLTGPVTILPMLRDNLWPKARPAGEHSHRMTYVGVFAALAVITAIEVLLSVLDDPGFNVVGPLVALSTAKVLLVVMYFMHLRYDSQWYAWVFAAAMPFAALVLVVLAYA